MSATIIAYFIQQLLYSREDLFALRTRLVIDLTCFTPNLWNFVANDIIESIVKDKGTTTEWGLTTDGILVTHLRTTAEHTTATPHHTVMIHLSMDKYTNGSVLKMYAKVPWIPDTVRTRAIGVNDDGLWLCYPREYHDDATFEVLSDERWQLLDAMCLPDNSTQIIT